MAQRYNVRVVERMDENVQLLEADWRDALHQGIKAILMGVVDNDAMDAATKTKVSNLLLKEEERLAAKLESILGGGAVDDGEDFDAESDEVGAYGTPLDVTSKLAAGKAAPALSESREFATRVFGRGKPVAKPSAAAVALLETKTTPPKRSAADADFARRVIKRR